MSKSTAPRNVLEGASAEHVKQSGDGAAHTSEPPFSEGPHWSRLHGTENTADVCHFCSVCHPSSRTSHARWSSFWRTNTGFSAVRFPTRRLWGRHAPTRNVILGSRDKQRPRRRQVLNRLLRLLLSRTLLPSCPWLWPMFPVWLSHFSDQSIHCPANKLPFYLSYSKPASRAHRQTCQLRAHGSRRGAWSKLRLRKATKHSYQGDSLQTARAWWASLTKRPSAQSGTLLRLLPWPVPLLNSTPDLTFHTGIFGGVPWWGPGTLKFETLGPTLCSGHNESHIPKRVKLFPTPCLSEFFVLKCYSLILHNSAQMPVSVKIFLLPFLSVSKTWDFLSLFWSLLHFALYCDWLLGCQLPETWDLFIHL